MEDNVFCWSTAPYIIFKTGFLHLKVVSCFHIYCLVSVQVRAVLARP